MPAARALCGLTTWRRRTGKPTFRYWLPQRRPNLPATSPLPRHPPLPSTSPSPPCPLPSTHRPRGGHRAAAPAAPGAAAGRWRARLCRPGGGAGRRAAAGVQQVRFPQRVPPGRPLGTEEAGGWLWAGFWVLGWGLLWSSGGVEEGLGRRARRGWLAQGLWWGGGSGGAMCLRGLAGGRSKMRAVAP